MHIDDVHKRVMALDGGRGSSSGGGGGGGGVAALGSLMEPPALLTDRVANVPPTQCHKCRKGVREGVPVPSTKSGQEWTRFAEHLRACKG